MTLLKYILFNEVISTLNKLYKSIIIVMLTVVFLPTQIFGFSLSDHEELSKIAIREFFRCVQPDMLHSLNRSALNRFTQVIVNASWEEDMNFLNKMLQYSHYYNPNFYVNFKWLNILDRCPSSYRIYHLEQILDAYLQGNKIQVLDLSWDNECQINSMLQITKSIEQAFQTPSPNTYNTPVLNFKLFHIDDETQVYERYFDMLGHAIHHLQDMSSPTHVVPIFHPSLFDSPSDSWEIFPQDGFEHNTDRIRVLNSIVSKSDRQALNEICTFKRSTPQTLFEVLDQSAKNTLGYSNSRSAYLCSKTRN